MRIVFIGTGEIGVPTLRKLLNSDHEVVAVVTQPDKPVGRDQQIRPPPIKAAPKTPGSSGVCPYPSAPSRHWRSRTASPRAPVRRSSGSGTARPRREGAGGPGSGDVLGEVLEELPLALGAHEPLDLLRRVVRLEAERIECLALGIARRAELRQPPP